MYWRRSTDTIFSIFFLYLSETTAYFYFATLIYSAEKLSFKE